MRSEFFILANVNKTQCCARTPEEKQRGRIRKQHQSLDCAEVAARDGQLFSTMMGGWTSDKIVAQLCRICKSAATKSSESNNSPEQRGNFALGMTIVRIPLKHRSGFTKPA
jgi:hypothetical protein